MTTTVQDIINLINRTLLLCIAVLMFAGVVLLFYLWEQRSNELYLQFFALATLIVFFALGLMLAARHRLIKKINEQLKFVTELEKWAENNYQHNVIQPVDVINPVGATIAKLQQKLLLESQNQTTIDKVFREKAFQDKETGIGNREFFNAHLEALLKEEDSFGIVCFIQFKEGDLVQTMYGNAQAMALLSSIISIIHYRLQSLTKYYIARRQPYEIALILPEISIQQGEKLADRLLKNFLALPLPVGINQEEFVHIGMSCYQGFDMPYQVMAEADMALRSAQLQGPAQWFIYEPGEVIHAQGSLKWRTFLTKVIASNGFVIFVQPVIDANSGNILHHEVLAKVRDGQGKLVSARIFMPMVHKCGLTEQVDLLIIKQVCKLMRYETTQQACSLNLSIESLLKESFVDKLMILLAENRDITNKLIFEVSEYRLVNHLSSLKPVLTRLEELGIKWLVDNVGQHVVSTQYLYSFPVSFIKLHPSLIANIEQKPENQMIIQSLKVTTEPMNIALYALGVETENEWGVLKRLGVNGGQGHYFTHPVEQSAFASLAH